MEFTAREMIMHGWPILSVLFIMSILSFTIIVERLTVFRRVKMDAPRFIAEIIRVLTHQGEAAALELCARYRRVPVAGVAAAILAQHGGREDHERAARNATQKQIIDMEMYLPILGTIAGTAPFVGLLGTVIGIFRAFKDISANAGAGPDVVSAGIAEALITTAVGLVVAIPAVMMYNYFIHRVRRLSEAIDLAAFDLIECLSRMER